MDERVKLLIKVANEPGLCTQDAIEDAIEWLEDFNELLDVYKAAYGDPVGFSVASKISRLKEYLNG
jgi:hypothetical protein